MFKKLKNKILTSSDSYNHYKKENEILSNDLAEKIVKLEQENRKLSKSVKDNEKILASYKSLFENIYLDFELAPKGLLNDVQVLGQELLLYIDNICKKHDLEYWLEYGTLLGAARHESFIPWDDDIDIGMMRKDFDKVYPILKEEVEKNGLDITVRKYHQNVPGIMVPFIQFSYRYPRNGTTLAYIDIFPYDYRDSEDDFNRQSYRKQFKLLRKRVLDGENESDVIKEYMDNFNLSYGESDYILPGPDNVSLYDLGLMDKNIIFPLDRIKFKDNYFPCPNDYKKHLEDIYGNYMEFPDVIRIHGLYKRVKQIDNVDKQYEIAINKLKEVNENF